MKTSLTRKSKAGLIIAAIIVICLLIRNQIVITRLDAANRGLTAAKLEVEKFARENETLPTLRVLNQVAEQIQNQTQDLPKLRNEIHLLRERAKEWNVVRAENKRLRLLQKKTAPSETDPVRPPGFIPLASFHDAGLSTPEATIQTAFWAMAQGNLERWSQCLVQGEDRLQQDREWQRKNIAEQMKSFSGFQIAQKKIISPVKVELRLQSAIGGTVLPVWLKLIGNEWKWDN